MEPRMRRMAIAGILVAALAAGAEATGAPERASGSMAVNSTLRSAREATPCPPGTSERSTCFRYTAETTIRGLGRLTTAYTKLITLGDPDCEVLFLNPAVLEVVGKGAVEFSTVRKTCWRFQLPTTIGPFEFTVTGGSGRYAGASGSLTFTRRYSPFPQGPATPGQARSPCPGTSSTSFLRR